MTPRRNDEQPPEEPDAALPDQEQSSIRFTPVTPVPREPEPAEDEE